MKKNINNFSFITISGNNKKIAHTVTLSTLPIITCLKTVKSRSYYPNCNSVCYSTKKS